MYSNSALTVIFVGLFLSWACSELFGPVRWSQRRQKEAKQDRGSLVLAIIIGIVALACAFFFPWVLPWSRILWQPAAFFLGSSFVLIGIIWRWYAIRTLGSLFTARLIVQENQQIIQHGPYRWVRHPSYTGFLLVILGFGLMIGSWLSVFLLFFGLGACLLYRIALEEQALLKNCPAYKEYMHRTKCLIPFLY